MRADDPAALALSRRARLARRSRRRRRRRGAATMPAIELALPARPRRRLRAAAADRRRSTRTATARSAAGGPAADPPIDCFYVYPTVSRDPGINSDLTPASRSRPRRGPVRPLRLVCRTFAPLYRQVDARARSRARFAGEDDQRRTSTSLMATSLAAWRYYLAHCNNGRPFVLIGHSQGTIHLTRLLAERDRGQAGGGAACSRRC